MNKKELRSQWPDVVLLLSGCLKAGMALDEALHVVLDEAPDPARAVLRSRLHGRSAWLPAPAKITRLFPDSELLLVRSLLLLSRDEGGRVASALEKCAKILRRRCDMEEKIATLTAQGKLSAWVVGLSPVFLLAGFAFLSPEFIRPLFTTRAGAMLLASAGVLVGAGLFFVHRLVQIEP